MRPLSLARTVLRALAHPRQAAAAAAAGARASFRFFGAGGRALPPSTIFLSVNSRCNLRCAMCDVGQRASDSPLYRNLLADGAELPLPVAERLFLQLQRTRPHIHVIGTEPLLYPALVDLIALAARYRLEISVTTNGFLLPDLAAALAGSRLHTLYVSLDGTEEIHDRLRGVPSSYRRATDGIASLSLHRQRLGMDRPRIIVSSTITPLNAGDLLAFTRAIGALAIDRLEFYHMNYITPAMAEQHNRLYGGWMAASQSCTTAIDPASININVLHRQIAAVTASRTAFPVAFVPDLRTAGELRDYYLRPAVRCGRRACTVPWTSTQIKANGDVVVQSRCFAAVLGNIGEQPWRQIWNGPSYRSFRRALRQHGTFPVCARCCGIL